MPDQDESAAVTGAEDDAAERLERALARIAASAHRAAAEPHRPADAALLDDGVAREVAARLDALIAQLRGALDRN